MKGAHARRPVRHLRSAPGEVELVELPRPEPGPGEVLVRLAVAGAFLTLMTAHPLLQHRAVGATFDANPQVRQIAELAPAAVQLRLTGHDGRPYDGANLTGRMSRLPWNFGDGLRA